MTIRRERENHRTPADVIRAIITAPEGLNGIVGGIKSAMRGPSADIIIDRTHMGQRGWTVVWALRRHGIENWGWMTSTCGRYEMFSVRKPDEERTRKLLHAMNVPTGFVEEAQVAGGD